MAEWKLNVATPHLPDLQAAYSSQGQPEYVEGLLLTSGVTLALWANEDGLVGWQQVGGWREALDLEQKGRSAVLQRPLSGMNNLERVVRQAMIGQREL